MNPYDVDYSKFKPSKAITDPKDLFKLKLLARIGDVFEPMTTDEIIAMTGLIRVRLAHFFDQSEIVLDGVLSKHTLKHGV